MLTPGYLLQSRYRVDRVLGEGGMGTVYRAQDESLGNKSVAIKEMCVAQQDAPDRQQAVQLFQNEARILATLDHPGLVDVTHYFEEDNNQYLVMEFVDGRTLEQVVRDTSGFLPVPQCVDWMMQVADVLEYLHGQEPPILFRDLKPSNVMLDARNHIRLIDFGISRVFDSSRTSAYLKGAGTAGFAPLEQLSQGTTDARSDVYSLGATLYSLVTRSIPPDAVDLVTGQADLVPPSKVNPEVPAALQTAILTMMSARKDGRYQTVAEARQAMSAQSDSAGVSDSSGALKPGAVLAGRYVMEKRIAGGRLGGVFLAHLRTLESRKVAVKVLRVRHESAEQHEKTMERLRQEASILAGMEHPNLVRLVEFFTVGARAYLVMDYVHGVSLAHMLKSADGFLGAPFVLALVRQLCDGLEYLHTRTPPIVFRDLKPANAMVTAEGRLKLVDFGLGDVLLTVGASRTDSFLRGTGTHGFAPIEQYMPTGTSDTTSDIYALGAIMYALFTGQPPPAAVELVSGQATLAPPESINPAVPAALGALVRKMMETQKKDRCQTIDEVRRHLDRVFASASEPSPRRPEGGPRSERKLVPLSAQRPGVETPDRSERPPVAAAPVAASAAAPDILSALYTAFHPTEVRMSASLPGRGHFLGFDTPSTRREPVAVMEVGEDGLTFQTRRVLKVPSTVGLRLSVPTHARNIVLTVDIRLVLTRRTAVEGELALYQGLFKDLPERLRPLLGNLERRRVRRVPENFQILGRSLPTHKALALDISPAGMGFTCHGPLAVDTLLDLTLDLSESHTGATSIELASTVAQVRIAHCARQMDGLYRMGAEFVSLAEASARSLAEHLKRLA